MKQITCRRILIPVAAGIVFLCLFFLLTTFASEKTTFTVFFVDEEDYDTKIFNTQSGSTFEGGSVSVSFPERLVGKDGYIWQSVEKSPQIFEVLQSGIHKYYVTYRQGEKIAGSEDTEDTEKEKLEQWLQRTWEADCRITGQDPESKRDPYLIVTKDLENNSRIKNLVSIINDPEWHYFYMIGKNYLPQTLVIGTELPAVYSSVTEDQFSIGNDRYHVARIGVRRQWNPQNCFHDWQVASKVKEGCLTMGTETYRCELCNSEELVHIPALGHMDKDGDSLCDHCGKRAFFQQVGDRIKTVLIGGGEKKELTFTCVDENYNGTGKMLYLADEVLDQQISGVCFGENSGYNDSPIRNYLNLFFPNDCSLGTSFLPIIRGDSRNLKDYAVLLSKEEYQQYDVAGLINQTPAGYFLRTFDPDSNDNRQIFAVNQEGSLVSVPAADNDSFGARPCILLEKPITGEPVEPSYWREGDIQIRQIADKNYRFICVDEDYSDNKEGHRKAALFLCDSIIRSDIDSSEAALKKLSFGRNNNYKTSEVRSWLSVNGQDTLFDGETVYTGVNAAYTGSTKAGTFEQMADNHLTGHEIEFQLMQDKLFCLSLEEALKYRQYLWRFLGAQANNAQSQISPYSTGYYLRTPFYKEDVNKRFQYSKDIYVVDLIRGNIHAANTDSEAYCLRPAFALHQQ